ncbi:hypothetical protein [Kitasatospora viridis]|uniref:Uncharacterized protein n=1 Tax=Kitasatospora viridis TaxID=281105 RepID=A0A561UAC4_9ACTN|nr:hypothetical protein [Kitasatospora viridis]TWF96303.1 hypothetical protein FHX73_1167 [Kitasatospora viridis]
MTAQLPRADPAAAYTRPPYRTPSPPRPAPRELVLDVLLPWRLARLVYGPYRTSRLARLTASGVTATVGAQVLDPYLQPVVTTIAEEALDPRIERLLTPRALLGLGIVLHLVRLCTGTWSANDLLTSAFGEDGVVMMLTGPIALLLGCLPLIALARPGTRRQVARLVARPLLVGLCTVAVFLSMMLAFQNGSEDTGGLLLAPVLLWLGLFVPCVLYLVHRNSFAVRAHPLARPLVAVPLVWLTVLGHLAFVDTKGTSTHGPALIALLAGPAGVTVTAVIEIVLLRRRHRVGFRGPLGPAAPSR